MAILGPLLLTAANQPNNRAKTVTSKDLPQNRIHVCWFYISKNDEDNTIFGCPMRTCTRELGGLKPSKLFCFSHLQNDPKKKKRFFPYTRTPHIMCVINRCARQNMRSHLLLSFSWSSSWSASSSPPSVFPCNVLSKYYRHFYFGPDFVFCHSLE